MRKVALKTAACGCTPECSLSSPKWLTQPRSCVILEAGYPGVGLVLGYQGSRAMGAGPELEWAKSLALWLSASAGPSKEPGVKGLVGRLGPPGAVGAGRHKNGWVRGPSSWEPTGTLVPGKLLGLQELLGPQSQQPLE